MRVLVTGASGHVGAAIAGHLVAAGHEVVGLSRGLSRSTRALSPAISADLGRPGLAATLASGQPRCEAIVHAAAAIDNDPFAAEISLTNCLGTQQMLELSSRWQASSFVFISSVPVIGRPVALPITERHPTDPPSAYHASKLYGERLTALAAREGTAAVSLRLTAPVGPGMRVDRILPVFVRRARAGERLEVAGRGGRCQDYVDARDVAAAVAAALERRATGVLNIASGRCVSNIDLAHLCVSVLRSSSEVGCTGIPDPEEGVRWEVSIAAAEGMLGYRPAHSLEDSIAAVAGELEPSTSV